MLYGLLRKTITAARGSRGIVHELWAYLKPQVFFWVLVTFSPATVFTDCTVSIPHTEVPAGVPIASDVVKVLKRNGAAANVELAAVLVLEQARAYAAMRHGVAFAMCLHGKACGSLCRWCSMDLQTDERCVDSKSSSVAYLAGHEVLLEELATPCRSQFRSPSDSRLNLGTLGSMGDFCELKWPCSVLTFKTGW